MAWGRGKGSQVWRDRVSGQRARDRAPPRRQDGGSPVSCRDEGGVGPGWGGAVAPRVAADRLGQLPHHGRAGRRRGAWPIQEELRALDGERGGGGMSVFTEKEIEYFGEQRLGRLATVDEEGKPHVVPVAFRYNAKLGTLDIGGRNFAWSK